ncbi:MAG: hypothetical protein ABR512_07085 [Desulfopila sp.]
MKPSKIQGPRHKRKGDPYLDRRSGEDRRKVHLLEYLLEGNPDRRSGRERRQNVERRQGCIRISEWSSACPDAEEMEHSGPYVINSV